MKKVLITLTSLVAALGIYVTASDQAKDADNTARNKRDRDERTVTPVDQSNKPVDVELTRSIRQAVMKDGSLSLTAKNVKIITADGKVTLRGPVNSPDEKKKIEDLAKGAAGKIPVVSQIEVKAEK